MMLFPQTIYFILDVFLLLMFWWAAFARGLPVLGHDVEEDEVLLDVGYEDIWWVSRLMVY